MKDTSFKRPTMKPHTRSPLAAIRRQWPILAWGIIILMTVFFYSRSTQFVGMSGVIDTPAEPIAPLDTARLLDIKVKVGDRIKAGDPVAQMDTALIDAEIWLERSNRAEAESSMESFQATLLQTAGTVERLVSQSEADLANAKIEQLQDTARLTALRAEQKRREGLRAKNIMNENDASALLPEIAALKAVVAGYPRQIEVLTKQASDARKQNESIRQTMKVGEGEDIMEAVRRKTVARFAIFSNAIERLEIEKSTYTLRASRDGIVSDIYKAEGDIISSGQPIIRMVGEKSDVAIGFLPEAYLSRMKVGEIQFVEREHDRTSTCQAKVESIAPEIDTFPNRVSPVPGQAMRGRRVILRVMGNHDFVPGETIRIRSTKTIFSVFKSLYSRDTK